MMSTVRALLASAALLLALASPAGAQRYPSTRTQRPSTPARSACCGRPSAPDGGGAGQGRSGGVAARAAPPLPAVRQGDERPRRAGGELPPLRRSGGGGEGDSVKDDVCACAACGTHKIERRRNLLSLYRRCPECANRAVQSLEDVIQAATYDDEGVVRITERCPSASPSGARTASTRATTTSRSPCGAGASRRRRIPRAATLPVPPGAAAPPGGGPAAAGDGHRPPAASARRPGGRHRVASLSWCPAHVARNRPSFAA